MKTSKMKRLYGKTPTKSKQEKVLTLTLEGSTNKVRHETLKALSSYISDLFPESWITVRPDSGKTLRVTIPPAWQECLKKKPRYKIVKQSK